MTEKAFSAQQKAFPRAVNEMTCDEFGCSMWSTVKTEDI